jgi:hypothetical protein
MMGADFIGSWSMASKLTARELFEKGRFNLIGTQETHDIIPGIIKACTFV